MLKNRIGRRIMTGTLGLACLLAAATSQASVLVNGISVTCVDANEIGQDEIFLRFASGATYTQCNMGNFSDGVSRGSTCSFVFSSLPITYQLWESDGNAWYDGDDLWHTDYRYQYGPWVRHDVEDGNQAHDYYMYFTLTQV
jgi:hypothetical protein